MGETIAAFLVAPFEKRLDFRHEKWKAFFNDPPDDAGRNVRVSVDQTISEVDDSTGSRHLLLQLGIDVDGRRSASPMISNWRSTADCSIRSRW
jgi:hypothetical protein